jgi:outer membrane beta-barrel protein
MESRTRVLLLTLVLAVGLSGCASLKWPWFGRHKHAGPTADEAAKADEDPSSTAPPRVIDPQVERRKIKVPKIHSQNVELGAFYGIMSVEDFGTNPVYGVQLDYHVTEDFFFEGVLGKTSLGKTSFELLNPGADPLNLGSGRRLTYYGLSLGYNFLPGEVFIGRNLAMNSTFYLLGGIGATRFADKQRFTVNFGAGYRVLPADWIALHIDVDNRMFESDIFGENKLTHNLEAHVGATVFF